MDANQHHNAATDHVANASGGHHDGDQHPADDAQAKFSANQPRGERGPDETLWEGGYSAVDQSGSFIILGLVTIGVIAGGIFFWPILFLIPILWIAQFIRVWWIKLGIAYRLTNRRFIHERGVISRTTDRIEVIDIDDVTVKQGILDRMFNVGSICITSSDRTHPELVLHGIKDVKKVALMIDDARQVQRDRRGVYIESV